MQMYFIDNSVRFCYDNEVSFTKENTRTHGTVEFSWYWIVGLSLANPLLKTSEGHAMCSLGICYLGFSPILYLTHVLKFHDS